jgi:multicomponent Na+:H+ antiporter subunit D
MNSIIAGILVPFFTAIALALLHGHPRAERALGLASTLGLTAFSFWLLAHVDSTGIQVSALGGYAAPYGIAFVADRLACIMLCLSTSVGAAALAYSFSTVTPEQERNFFHPLFQVALLGVNWSFLTGDLFNLFVAYEVMLIGSYGVMMVGASRAQVRQTLMYVAVNLVGGTLFVAAVALVYATTGTLNFADLARVTATMAGPQAAAVTTAAMILLLVFAIKAAIFPVFFWLPDSYPVVPAGVNGFFAGLMTKVGIYSLLRVFVMTFRQPGHEVATELLLFLSGLTMILGVLGAVCQWEIRRILSWHIISQVGYMVMGIGLASDPLVARAAIAGTVFYIVHHIIVKSSLFLLGDLAVHVTGYGALKRMGGVLTLAPAAAGLFFVAALSLAGMPPFSGFLSKLLLIQAGLAGGHGVVVAAAVATGFLTIVSMLKIWSYAFWGPARPKVAGLRWHAMAAPASVLVAASVVFGLWAQPLLRLAGDTADELLQPRAYLEAVLGADSAQAGASAAPGTDAATATAPSIARGSH